MNRKRDLPQGDRPSSAAPPASNSHKPSSAAQPASVPPRAVDDVCFITYNESMQRLHYPEPKLNMLLALRTAMSSNPIVLVLSFQHPGTDLETTQKLMEEWAADLAEEHAHGRAKKIIRKGCVQGLIHFDFQPQIRVDTLDPEMGFPAMLLNVGSLTVVAASWPIMPTLARERVLKAYIEAALASAAQPAALVVGGALNMDLQIPLGHLADKCPCRACQNGSGGFLLQDENARVFLLQAGEPNITRIASALPRRPPVVLSPERHGKHIPQPARGTDRGAEHRVRSIQPTGDDSAEQPVRSRGSPAAIEAAPEPETPLFDNFLDCMNHSAAGAEIMNFIAETCFHKDFLWIDEKGVRLGTPRSIGSKTEVMMKKVIELRTWYVHKLAGKLDPRVPEENPESVLNSLAFTEDDMKYLMNEWRHYVISWMNPVQLQRYERATPQQQHGMEKSNFSTYLAQLSGCKFLLRRLIALPLLNPPSTAQLQSSAAQPGSQPLVDPEIMLQLTREWTVHKTSEEHREAVRKSLQTDQARLSIRIANVQKLFFLSLTSLLVPPWTTSKTHPETNCFPSHLIKKH